MFSKFIKMDSENHYRLVMTNPVKGDCIYKTKDIKKAGRKAFATISKKFNINKSLITLIDLNTNKEYKFLALKPPYINEQTGGATDNKAFMDKIKNITETLDKSLESLDEAIEEKQQKDNDNNIILIAKNGISKLDEILNQLDNINKKIDAYNGILPKEEKEDNNVKEEEKVEEKEDVLTKEEIETIKEERLDNKNQENDDENLLQPLIPPFEGENLCIIM
jgi:hypothetical protein